MHTTAQLPSGRLRAFMEQRVIYEGKPMARYVALQMAAGDARGWRGLDAVIDAEHQPIEEPSPIEALRESLRQERSQAALAMSII